MNNIDEFNRACVIIFAKLYDAFPIPISLEPVSAGFIPSGNAQNEPRIIFSATLVFLAEEGYIQFNRATDGKAQKDDVRLTSKGLTRLQKTPSGIEGTLAEQLKSFVGSVGGKTGTTAATATITQLVRMLFGG